MRMADQGMVRVPGRLRHIRFSGVTPLVLFSVLMLATSPLGSALPDQSQGDQARRVSGEIPVDPSAVGLSTIETVYPVAAVGLPTADARSLPSPGSAGVSTVAAGVKTANDSVAEVTGTVPAGSHAVESTLAISSRSLLRNGTFELGMAGWISSHLQQATTTSVVDVSGDQRLELSVAQSEGAIAQDVAVRAEAGSRYAASIRAESPSGFPVLVELAVHALSADGTIGETSNRLVMVEGYEVPITTVLRPTVDHPSIRVEVYVHTVGPSVRLDDATLLVDDSHDGAAYFGYHQARVRYLDDPVTGPVDLAALTPGGRYRVAVTVETTTDQPWLCCSGTGAVRLGTEDEDLVGGSARTSELFVPPEVAGSNWINQSRVKLDNAESTIGGSFTTLITAPSEPGPFSERFRLVSEGVTWMPGPVIEIIGSVTDDANQPADPKTPTTGDDGSDGGRLLASCRPGLSIAADDPVEPECATEVSEFELRVTGVARGTFTVEWQRPDVVPFDYYVVEVEDLGLDEGERQAKSRILETGERTVDIDVPAGRYVVRVVALDDRALFVRSADVVVEVAESAPLIETKVPTIDLPPAPIPAPGDDGTCETVAVTFEREVLLRYRGEDWSTAALVDLPCSRYEVRLESSDPNHVTDYQADQTNERWYLEGFDAAGQRIFYSDPTPDLPEHKTEATFSLGVVELDGVVAFRARHVGGSGSANSIGVAAVLIPVG